MAHCPPHYLHDYAIFVGIYTIISLHEYFGYFPPDTLEKQLYT